MKDKYILSIDQSTSGTKAILFDRKCNLLYRDTIEHTQYYPEPGWVEHNPEEIYKNTITAIKNVLEQSLTNWEQIAAISVTNQRETGLVWNRETGKPIYNAVVWQCNRAQKICEEIDKMGYSATIKEKTGLNLSPYFTASKIKWILDNVAGAKALAEEGKLLFGTMDTWLIWKLTNGISHATDYSNASRTQLFNINTLEWDSDLLDIFGIPAGMMPEVKCSDAIFGYTARQDNIADGIAITGVLGDSHAALFGQNCYEKGMTKATYGTGSSVMMNIGSEAIQSKKGLVTSIGWGMSNKIEYVLEGNINCAGATIKWLEDDIQLIKCSRESEQIAASVKDNGGVYLVPAFVGLSAPYWDSNAKASITGMTRGTKKAHLVRAAEESIAYQIKDIVDCMICEAGITLDEFRVDGGPTRDGFLMQFQADMLQTNIITTSIEELSALGSANMAGLAVGYWKNTDEINELRRTAICYRPSISKECRDIYYNGWCEAVKRTLSR